MLFLRWNGSAAIAAQSVQGVAARRHAKASWAQAETSPAAKGGRDSWRLSSFAACRAEESCGFRD